LAGEEPGLRVRVEGGPAEDESTAGELRIRTEYGGLWGSEETGNPAAAGRLRSEVELGHLDGLPEPEAILPGSDIRDEYAAMIRGAQGVPFGSVPAALEMLERAVVGAGRGELVEIATALRRSLSAGVGTESAVPGPGRGVAADLGARAVMVSAPAVRADGRNDSLTGPDAPDIPAFSPSRVPVAARHAVSIRSLLGPPESGVIEPPDGTIVTPSRQEPAGDGNGYAVRAGESEVGTLTAGELRFRLASAGFAFEEAGLAVARKGLEAAPVRFVAEGVPEGMPGLEAGEGPEIRVRTILEAGVPVTEEPVRVELPAEPLRQAGTGEVRQTAVKAGMESTAGVSRDAAVQTGRVETAPDGLRVEPVKVVSAGTSAPVEPAAGSAIPEEPALLFAGGSQEEKDIAASAVSSRVREIPVDPLRAENRVTARFGSAAETVSQKAADPAGRVMPVGEILRSEFRETVREEGVVVDALTGSSGKPVLTADAKSVPAPVRAVLESISDTLAKAGKGELKEIQIRVDTAELGRVRVRFELVSEGSIRVEIAVSSQQAAQSLREGLPYLRQMIEMQRLSVEIAQIAVGPAADFGNGGQPRPQMRWFDFEPRAGGTGRQEELDVAGIMRAGFTGRLSMVDVLA